MPDSHVLDYYDGRRDRETALAGDFYEYQDLSDRLRRPERAPGAMTPGKALLIILLLVVMPFIAVAVLVS